MARHNRLTDAKIVERLCEGIKAGLTYRAALARVGVMENVFYKWRRLGRQQEEGRYFEFNQKINQVEAELEFELLTDIKKAGKREWRAAKWMITRQNRSGYKDEKEPGVHDGDQTASHVDAIESLRERLPEDKRDQLDDLLESIEDGDE